MTARTDQRRTANGHRAKARATLPSPVLSFLLALVFAIATLLHTGTVPVGQSAHGHAAAAGVAADAGDPDGACRPGDGKAGEACAAGGGCLFCAPVGAVAATMVPAAEPVAPVLAAVRVGAKASPGLRPPRPIQNA